jgi:hypothetical protein
MQQSKHSLTLIVFRNLDGPTTLNKEFYMLRAATSLVATAIVRELQVVTVEYGVGYINYVVCGPHNSIVRAIGALKEKIRMMMTKIFDLDDRIMYKWLKQELRDLNPQFQTNQCDSHPQRYKTVVSALKDIGYDAGAHTEKIDKLFQRLTKDVLYRYMLLRCTNEFLHTVSIRVIDTTLPECPYENTQNELCNTFAECLNAIAIETL